MEMINTEIGSERRWKCCRHLVEHQARHRQPQTRATKLKYLYFSFMIFLVGLKENCRQKTVIANGLEQFGQGKYSLWNISVQIKHKPAIVVAAQGLPAGRVERSGLEATGGSCANVCGYS